jgi:hypothetical protein
MKKIDIDFRMSGTGSYSPWHMEIIHKYKVRLMCTADIGSFVKIGEDIYRIRNPYKLYQYVTMLEEMNDKGEISDEEVLKEIDDIVNNRNKDFRLEKCQPLDEFEQEILKYKDKES